MKIDMGHIVLGGVVVGMYLHQRKRTAQSDARVVCKGVDDKKPDGGEVSLFDDFDIDFNKYAYLTDYAVGTDKGGVSPIVANYMIQMEDFGGDG